MMSRTSVVMHRFLMAFILPGVLLFISACSPKKSSSNNNQTSTLPPVTSVEKAPPVAPTVTTPNYNPMTSASDSLLLVGACENGAMVSLIGDAQESVQCENKIYSFNLAQTQQGTYNYQLLQRDAAGNVSPSTAFIWIKTTTLAAPTISLPATSPILGKSPTMVVSGTCVPGKTVALTGDLIQSNVCPPSGQFSLSAIQVTDGTYHFNVTQADLTSNIVSSPQPLEWHLDMTPPPPITLSSPNKNPYKRNTTALSLVVNCETGSKVKINGPLTQEQSCVGGMATFTDTQNVAGSFTYVLTQTDLAGNTSSSVSFNWQSSPLNIILSAPEPHVLTEGTIQFLASGGEAPYIFSLLSGSSFGSIDPASGLFTASQTAGVATIKVMDDSLSSATMDLIVYSPLTVTPLNATLNKSQTQQLSVSGGIPPYTFVVSGAGTVDSSGLYTAPNAATTDVITVTDSINNTVIATLDVVESLFLLNPAVSTIATTNSVQLIPQNGQAPYLYSVLGVGAVDATGLFTSGSSGTATVTVMDALGRSASATVNVNAALSVSPLADFALLSQNKPFTASGGVSPYSFSVQNSLGTINNLTGVFTPSHLGQENVTVTDALGNTASTTVDIFNSVVLTPTSVTLAVNNQTTFVASQGLAPYNFTVSCGTINASGLYTAPASTDTCTVTVTDAHNTTATANVTIAPAISLSPVTATLLTTGTHSFAASGGVPPYTYTMQSGLGTVNGTSGLYTASTTAGTEVVLVTDALGNTATSSVMVVGPLILSPSFQTIASGGTLQLNTSGGLGAKIFSITSGSGSLDSNSGLFIGTSSGLTLVSVTDSLLNTSTGTVTVLAPLNLNPTTATLGASQTITLTASGGQGPYTYSVSAGQGSVNASGLFTAPNTGGTSQVKVTDSFGSQSISNISTLNPLVITPSSITMAESNSYTFAASGGGGSHHFSAILGTITSDGIYTPSSAGVDTVTVTDDFGSSDSASVTVNPVLDVDITTATIPVSNSLQLTAIDGVPPYSYAVTSGGGTVNATGLFTAPGSSGTTVVTITDSLSNSVTSTFVVVNVVSLSPATATIAVNNTLQTITAGGSSPYTYSVVSGGGTINASGLYTPSAAGTAVVKVTEKFGGIATSTITIEPLLMMTPTTGTLVVNTTFALTANQGVPPYTYSMVSGGGSVDSAGVFTAPVTAGTSQVRVTDSLGNTAQSQLLVVPQVVLTPSVMTTVVNNQIQFVASGGTPPFVFTTTCGSINASGLFTAPATSGVCTVNLKDFYNTSASANITVNPALQISPTTYTLATNGIHTFSATGGVSPYTYSMVSGSGSINSALGLYVAPVAPSTDVVKVTDSLGNTASATITVLAVLSIDTLTPVITEVNTATFTVSGGYGGNVFSVTTGSINTSGVYFPPANVLTAINVTVQVTDSHGGVASTQLTVNPLLSVSPATVTVQINTVQQIYALDGVPPYTYNVSSGEGMVDTDGLFAAPPTVGTSTINITDLLGNSVNMNFNIVNTLLLAPQVATIAVNNTLQMTGEGGALPYFYEILSGGGSIDPDTGLYTAGSSSGSTVVQLTDGNGNTSTSTITVNPALAITQGSYYYVPVAHQQMFMATGGLPPYVWSISSGDGTIATVSNQGDYHAPVGTGTTIITVTDSLNNTDSIQIENFETLQVSPNGTVPVAYGAQKQFTIVGGYAPITIAADLGTFDEGTGIYTAPASGGTEDTLTFTDAINNTVTVTLPLFTPMTLPTSYFVDLGGTITIQATGGYNSVTYSITSGDLGTLDANTGWLNPSVVTIGTVTATDEANNSLTTTVQVFSGLSMSPLPNPVAVNRSASVVAIGGSGISTVEVIAGGAGGTIYNPIPTAVPLTYAYRAPSVPLNIVDNGDGTYSASDVIQMSDTFGQTTTGTIQLVWPLKIISSGQASHSCVLMSNGGVKCWGLNTTGQLGINSVITQGTGSLQMGSALPFVNLGTGVVVKDLAVGGTHTCALIASSNSVKCWGNNSVGQLGTGLNEKYGQINASPNPTPVTTGSYSVLYAQAVKFAGGKTVKKIYAGTNHTCAILSDDSTACWGSNSGGQVGSNSTTTSFKTPVPVPLDTSLPTPRYATSLSLGDDHTCALLNDGKVRCWGSNGAVNGQLGTSDTKVYGRSTTAKVAMAPTVNLGSGRTAVKIMAAKRFTCAILDDATTKCWGVNTSGNLGLNHNISVGTSPTYYPIASNLPIAGSSFSDAGALVTDVAGSVTSTQYSTCLTLTSGNIKCFGSNQSKQLGIPSSSTTTTIAVVGNVSAGTLASVNQPLNPTVATTSSPYANNFTDIGNSSSNYPVSIIGGSGFFCALLADNEVKCWGVNSSGQLGLKDKTTRGSNSTQMGQNLPPLNFGGNP